MLLGLSEKASGEADVADLQPVDVNPQSTPEDMMMSEISGENKDFKEFDPDEPPPSHIGNGSGSEIGPVRPAGNSDPNESKPLTKDRPKPI